MRTIQLIALIGVMALVVAIGLGINAGITGHSIFGGSSQNSANDDNSNSNNAGIEDITNNENVTDVIFDYNASLDEEENETYESGGGGSDIPAPVPEDEVCDFADNDLDGEIDEIGCANLNGIVSDADNGLPIEGANISFYSQSTYDVYADTGDYSLLVPKATPDVVTDSNGAYNVSILEGDYHMVIQSSDEKDFNVKANKSNGDLKHDVEIDEDRANDNFNAEGHILYSGESEYGNENKYACGDVMKFMMFGINHGTEDETITFVVQDHSSIGGPTAPVVYNGNISEADESLIIHAGLKEHKVFDFQIPCGFNSGKHDIHVIWEGSKFHKIGNFFVVPDTTAPNIDGVLSVSGFPNENIAVGYSAHDQAQSGTVRATEFSILGDTNETLTVIIDKNIDEDGGDPDSITDNDADYTINGGGSNSINLTYNESGDYVARFTVMDITGNEAEEPMNVSVRVFITEEEANSTAIPIYSEFGLDLVFEITRSIFITRTWDRFDDISLVGDEYLTDEDDIDAGDISSLNSVIASCSGPYMKVIEPVTTEGEYETILRDYLNYLCTCPSTPIPTCPVL